MTDRHAGSHGLNGTDRLTPLQIGASDRTHKHDQPMSTKSGNYALGADDQTVLVSATATITLPTAVGIAGKVYIIKNTGTGVVTIATTSSQTVDGVSPPTLDVAQETLVLQSDNANWHVI